MAHDPLRSRGVEKKPKRPNTTPFDRGRVATLETEVKDLQEAGGGA